MKKAYDILEHKTSGRSYLCQTHENMTYKGVKVDVFLDTTDL